MKKRFYFVLAGYFKFWARLQLRRWRPSIYVITGSSGKTTTLHLVESQLGADARYSHHANSAYGVCFDILGLGRKKLARMEWLYLVSAAPFRAFKKPFEQKIYVVEVDCDRPREGAFLADLLKPHGVIWLSSTQTHAVNFDGLVKSGQFESVEAAIAHEYGYLLRAASDFSIVNRDNSDIMAETIPDESGELFRCREFISVSSSNLASYHPNLKLTSFEHKGEFKQLPDVFSIPSLVPEAVGVSALAVMILCIRLGHKFKKDFTDFQLPPGRSSVFAGIKKSTLIDSTYNASLDAAEEILQMFQRLSTKTKWLVVSDILEQGLGEKTVHMQLAEAISKVKADKVIIMGPRTNKFTSPTLTKLGVKHVSLETPRQVLELLEQDLQGGETILFKGTRFLEGVVEHLLADPSDASKLCRREDVWVRRRKAWGL